MEIVNQEQMNYEADKKTIDSVKETIRIINNYKELGFDMSGCWYTCPVRLHDTVLEELKRETTR